MAQETSASKTSDQMIRLNVFSFLGEKKCSSISQKKKNNENSFQMVSNPSLPREEEFYLKHYVKSFVRLGLTNS